jgi:hypothetical protein
VQAADFDVIFLEKQRLGMEGGGRHQFSFATRKLERSTLTKEGREGKGREGKGREGKGRKEERTKRRMRGRTEGRKEEDERMRG